MKRMARVIKMCCAALIASTLLVIYPNEGTCQVVEAYLVGQQMSGDRTGNSVEAIELDKSFAAGFGAGFGIGHIIMNLDFLFGSTKAHMQDVELDTKLSNVDINIDYNLLKSRITPMATIGLGSVTFSESFTSTDGFMETDFSYNYGIGVRWLVTNRLLLKALYRTTITKIKDTENSVHLSGASIMMGYSVSFLR